MENHKKILEVQLHELNSLLKQSNKNVTKYKDLDNGHIHVSRCRGNFQYYYIDKTHGTRRYMGADDEKDIRKYIQKDYELALNERLKVLQKRIQKFISLYDIKEFLNTRTRKNIYWEHLGILSDMDYASKNFKKIHSYEKNGYLQGRDLIITMESSDAPIDVRLVEEKIREFLL